VLIAFPFVVLFSKFRFSLYCLHDQVFCESVKLLKATGLGWSSVEVFIFAEFSYPRKVKYPILNYDTDGSTFMINVPYFFVLLLACWEF